MIITQKKPLEEVLAMVGDAKTVAVIGCGLCAKNCPEQAIRMQAGKPFWVKEKCAACLECLHRCPKFAIQYGEKTKHHGQYLHPAVHETIKKK